MMSVLPVAPTLWYKARVGLLAAADGAAIATWQDQSGNGNHATQTTAGNRPTRAAAQVNGRDAVRFTAASNQYFDLPNVLSAFTAAEGFFVLKASADPPAGMQGALCTIGTNDDALYPYSDGSIYDDFASSVRKSTGNPSLALDAWRVYNVSSASGEWTSRLDGVQHYTTATNTVSLSTTPRLGRSINGTFTFDGWIAEFILFSSVLSAANRRLVDAYLASIHFGGLVDAAPIGGGNLSGGLL